MPVKSSDPSETDELEDQVDLADEAEEETPKLNLEVQIASPSACERHVTVTVSREDIDRYFNNAFSEMMPEAAVPGFRPGRAPRKVVENRFKKEVSDQVKGSLLMDSLSQISEEQTFAAISEPDLNLDAVEVPDEGPMTFEFNIEVRPEFDLPEWKGLKIKRPTRTFTDEDVQEQLEQMIARYGQLVPHNGPAASGDYLTVNITTTADGQEVERDHERVLRIRPVLSLIDSRVENFDMLMEGVTAGDRRQAEVKLTQGAPNEELRGKAVQLQFEVLEVKKLKLPELDEQFLKELGEFETEDALRDAIRKNLERQLEYHQQQNSREQITSLLIKSAEWELPPGLLKRQSMRELERAVMELRRSGFSEAEIRARENQLRQNSSVNTAQALKEHFILERIAEEEKLDVEDGDYDKEIFLMAAQSGESPRRVRAQLEKRGLMDVLRNQIIERKVLELVQSHAKFQDEKYVPEKKEVEAISFAAGGGLGGAIPEAHDHDEDEDEV